MNETTRIVSADVLQDFVTKLFERSGMRREDAAYCGYALVQTNIWGIDSHGVLRAPVYLERLSSGAVNATPELAANFVFGDDDLCTLYITATTTLYSIRVQVQGHNTFPMGAL